MNTPAKNSDRAIFDVLYGFIPITEWEEKIINSPFYQRLRWIRQLGFSTYIFPGAEHNRFSHAIGVMHSMGQMINALGIGVSYQELHDPKSTSEKALLHKSLRIAALLHDVGTFPFSHAVEYAYLRHGNDGRANRDKQKKLPNSHEHLGSFIIKNTLYEGGITQILSDYGLDVQLISDIIKGESPYLIANQLMHSDLDADRMDYLMRDSHYTGIKYGQFDREFVLSNLVTYEAGHQIGYGVKESATTAVEDFLISRYSWYSQVIRNPGSAKFDVMATAITESFLDQNLFYQFHDLLEMVEKKDERFFGWNDIYFMSRSQQIRLEKLSRDEQANELTEMLIYRIPPKTLKHEDFEPQILRSETEKTKLVHKIEKTVENFKKVLEKKGDGSEWILVDIPEKDVIFTKGYDEVIRNEKKQNLYQTRDPIKIVSKEGNPSLLVERSNSIISHISQFVNFIPAVYANDSAHALLKKEGLIQ
ncbi:MAG: hypothetical protein CL678_13775 [Bdellovibrionaceae bacterium]|nr:hypothetical protein [Pseudobdellovibrionaceae bacterium]|tara:strand:- start:2839 stop:4266 length:1428 start_codon:yes stop_codon:yes gene_type:complete